MPRIRGHDGRELRLRKKRTKTPPNRTKTVASSAACAAPVVATIWLLPKCRSRGEGAVEQAPKPAQKSAQASASPALFADHPQHLILAEHDRSEPAGHQRHHRGDEAIT